MLVRYRDVLAGGPERWLLVTRWGSVHLPRLRRRPAPAPGPVFDYRPEWSAARLARIRWYLEHEGDMTGAPPWPGEEQS